MARFLYFTMLISLFSVEWNDIQLQMAKGNLRDSHNPEAPSLMSAASVAGT
jgi:hypothetical protein